MQKILSVDNMRRSDAHTIATQVSGRELMRRAGRAVFESVEWKPPVAVVCGSGNNAGDGYVIARLLHDSGIDCTIVLLEDRFSEDGRYYFDICIDCGIPVVFWDDAQAADSVTVTGCPGNDGEGISLRHAASDRNDDVGQGTDKRGFIGSLSGFSTIVDCIFGTGFRGEATGPAADVIGAVNCSGAFVVSVDINSGLNGDTGMAASCVISDITVSIGSFKPGHFLNMAKDVMKRKINCEIGIEPVDFPFYLMEKSDFKPFFGKRKEYSNKGDFGYTALIGGSARYSGAIRLAAMANAAMRSGAGVVKVAVPESLSRTVASNILESTLFPLSDRKGELVFSEKEFEELISHVKTVAFGMGIGVTEETGAALKYLLCNYSGRMIIDADGLTLLSKLDRDVIANSKADLILTPHLKEFSRLTGKPIEEILASPVETARNYAAQHHVILLLKGPSTIVTDGDRVYFTDTGCSGMATAGSGDVLSGILAAVCAYLSETAGPVMSVAAGAYINGRAGELAQQKTNSISMVAGDTVSCIAEVISEIAV